MKKIAISFVAIAVCLAGLLYYLHHRTVMTVTIGSKKEVSHQGHDGVVMENGDSMGLPADPVGKSDKKSEVGTEVLDRIAPFTSTGDATGEISIDLSNYQHLQVGSKIVLETVSGQHPITIKDIILNDDGSYSYTLQGDDGTNSLFIYFRDTGKSYVSLSTKNMYIASFLDENGVGKYTVIPSKN